MNKHARVIATTLNVAIDALNAVSELIKKDIPTDAELKQLESKRKKVVAESNKLKELTKTKPDESQKG